MSVEQVDRDLVEIINSSRQRQEYCGNPVNGKCNTAAYALLDIFRLERIITGGISDSTYIRWAPEDKLVALNMACVIPARIPDAVRHIKLVAENFDLQAVGISKREGFRPVVLDEARISWILTYPCEFYPDMVTFQSKKETIKEK